MRHMERNVKALRMRREGAEFSEIAVSLGISEEAARRAVWCADMFKQDPAPAGKE